MGNNCAESAENGRSEGSEKDEKLRCKAMLLANIVQVQVAYMGTEIAIADAEGIVL